MASVAADDAAVVTGASRSFQHPLGFTKIALVDELPFFMLRLHVWMPTAEVPADHIHDHRFGFASAVLRGGYDMQLYQRASTGVPVTEYREEVSQKSGWHLNQVGPAYLQLLSTIRIEQGSSYVLPPEALHRVTVVPKSPSITLFLQTAARRGETQVFVEAGKPVPARSPKEAITVEAYRRQFSELLALLTA